MAQVEGPFSNINELLNHVMDVCPFPAAAQRLMTLVNDDGATLEAIVLAVQCDPALATQVLRVANSAAFRLAGMEPVVDLKQALVNVGLDELRVMAGAMALLSTFASRDELSLDLHHTSAVSGAIAEAVAPSTSGRGRCLPLICGLLCEVGALACLVVDGPSYVAMWRSTVNRGKGHWSLDAVLARDAPEIRRYGFTTRTIGARLLRRHQLPEEIAAAIEAEPRSPPDAPLIHRATAFARIVTGLIVDTLGTSDAATVAPQIAAIARLTSLTEVDGSDLVRRCLMAAASMERKLREART